MYERFGEQTPKFIIFLVAHCSYDAIPIKIHLNYDQSAHECWFNFPLDLSNRWHVRQ